MHNAFTFYLLWEVIKAKIQISFRAQANFVKKKIIKIFPKLEKYLKIQKGVPLIAFKRWKNIKREILKQSEHRKVLNVKD